MNFNTVVSLQRIPLV